LSLELLSISFGFLKPIKTTYPIKQNLSNYYG
jgi:hypothetical protein